MKNIFTLSYIFLTAIVFSVTSCSSSKMEVKSSNSEKQTVAVQNGKSATGNEEMRTKGPGMLKGPEITYVCTKHDYTSKEPGSCPTHTTDLLKAGTYYCAKDDGITSTKAGACPLCHEKLTILTLK